LPALQIWPAAQVTPQAPQFRGSVAGNVQTPPQSMAPGAHTQLPAWQT
jgi:hypothetical protein